MPKLKAFQDELPVPDVVHPISGPTPHHLSIVARPEKVKLHHDLPAGDVWCYRLEHGHVAREGRGTCYLGPTVEVQRGSSVTVAWRNGISKAHKLPFEVIKVPTPMQRRRCPSPRTSRAAAARSPTRRTCCA